VGEGGGELLVMVEEGKEVEGEGARNLPMASFVDAGAQNFERIGVSPIFVLKL
jgi:hypothetical protein